MRDRLSVSRDGQAFATRYAIEQLGQVCFRVIGSNRFHRNPLRQISNQIVQPV